MIRALILCGVVAGVGFGANDRDFERLWDVDLNNKVTMYRPYMEQQEKRIKALEKRVEVLELENACYWAKEAGVRPDKCAELFPKINPHPFGSEPEELK